MKHFFVIAAAAMFACVSAFAQPGMGGGFPGGGFPGGGFPGGGFPGFGGEGETLSYEDQAKEKVEEMKKELNLTEKQCKKLVRQFKVDIQYRAEAVSRGAFSGMGGGMMGGGMMGGGMMGGGMMGGGSNRQTYGLSYYIDEKYLAKEDKRLRKTLGEELYNQWRANHPAETVEDIKAQEEAAAANNPFAAFTGGGFPGGGFPGM